MSARRLVASSRDTSAMRAGLEQSYHRFGVATAPEPHLARGSGIAHPGQLTLRGYEPALATFLDPWVIGVEDKTPLRRPRTVKR